MPAITVNSAEPESYRITDSSAFVANSLLFINNETTSFFVSYPDPTPAGLSIRLVKRTEPTAAKELATAVDNVPDPDTFNHRIVTVSRSTDSLTHVTTLQCTISEPLSPGRQNEHYEVQVSADNPTAWTYAADDRSDIIQIVCEPVAELTGLSANLIEKQSLELTAKAASTSTNRTIVRDDAKAAAAGLGTNPPAPIYRFGHEGHLAILGLPSPDLPGQVYPLTKPLPGVYAPTQVPFTVEVTYPGVGGASFLSRKGVSNSTISARPQHIQLMLDRSRSMNNEHRWDNAKTAARIFINFFGEFRTDVNGDDRIGVTVFEDPGPQVFRTSPPAGPPFITDVIPLGAPAAVANGDLGPEVFGHPTSNTPLGDGLFFGLRKLLEAGQPPNVRFTAVLLADGENNCGTITFEQGPVPGNPRTWEQAKADPAIKPLFDPTTDFNMFAIGLGVTADFRLLQGLVPKDNFKAAIDVGTLLDLYASMFTLSQEANKLNTRFTFADIPQTATSGPEIFFNTTAAQRFGVAVLKEFDTAEPIDAVEIALWNGTAFVVQDIKPGNFEGHFYIGVPNASEFGDNGTAIWRIRRFSNSGQTIQDLTPTDVFIFEDLHVKSDLTLDKKDYKTGDPMVLSVEIRDDGEPVRGATVRAVLDAPADSLGSLLATLDQADLDPQQLSRTDDDMDRATGHGALVESVLHKYGWDHLPRCNPDPGGLFDNGTDLLIDKDGDGIYTATFRKVNAEGIYNWTISASGQDAHGRTFSHRLDASVLAEIGVSARNSLVKTEKIKTAPQAPQAVKVTVTPRDDFKNLLGPGFDRTILWAVDDGQFEHVVNHQPAPVNTDGTYTRTVLFKRGQRPTLRVSVNGVSLPRIPLT
jgi:hypothetical protein